MIFFFEFLNDHTLNCCSSYSLNEIHFGMEIKSTVLNKKKYPKLGKKEEKSISLVVDEPLFLRYIKKKEKKNLATELVTKRIVKFSKSNKTASSFTPRLKRV